MDNDKFSNVDLTAVRSVVRCGFSNRRKMFVNNIMNTYKLKREQAEDVLISAGISLTVRGENLSAEEYVNLSKVCKEKGIIKWVKNKG